MKSKLIGVTAAILTILMATVPAFAWYVDIDASVGSGSGGWGSAAVWGAGSGATMVDEKPIFSYSVAASGGIINGDGDIDLGGGGSNSGGGMGVEISGSGASGELIFATHDLTTEGCCQDGNCAPCPPTYVYDASSSVTVEDGKDVEIHLGGGGGSGGAGQKLKVDAEGTVDASMSASLTVGGEPVDSATMGAYGTNVEWFKAFGKQGFDADDCDIGGMFFAIMSY